MLLTGVDCLRALCTQAYRTVEDVHAMLAIMPIRPKAKPMAAYHAQLAKVFWVAGNTLFHAMSLIRLFTLSKTFATQPSASELSVLASRAVLAVLATPLDPPVADVNLLEYDLEHEKSGPPLRPAPERLALSAADAPHAHAASRLADSVHGGVCARSQANGADVGLPRGYLSRVARGRDPLPWRAGYGNARGAEPL